MRYWIFQGNPDKFDLDGYIKSHETVRWAVRQEHLSSEMNVNDKVYLWRAAGTSKLISGVIAKAHIKDGPMMMTDDVDAEAYWNQPDESEKSLRVTLQIEHRCQGPKEVVKRKWCIGDPILYDLRIIKMASQTNFDIKPRHAQRLDLLCQNTGRDWSWDECVAGLWAFRETEGKEVSRRQGKPVAQVALLIGRAVEGVYNKVMNYRSIDPNDPRKGLSSTNKLDHEVWNHFYLTDKKSLDSKALDDVFRDMWNPQVSAIPQKQATYEDFGEAPDDDPHELAQFAARVRKGQKKFRDRLIQLYGGECAISGWGPEEVLEAAHIDRHSKRGINHSSNGLLLRADLHCLFDLGYLRIDPNKMIVRLHSSLRSTKYWRLNGRVLRSRSDGSKPAKEYLKSRWKESKDIS